MSKLLWKALLVSPVVLGVTLVIAADRVGAANGNSLLATESQPATQTAVEPTVGAVKLPVREAVTRGQLTPVSSEPKLPIPLPVMPATDTPVAQATPTAQTHSDVLEQSDPYRKSNSNALDQVTNVSQLSDVSPGDWAYEALRSLVERYGCIAGYPDSTFRGNRPMTRFEFAAGLNACLNQVERLIATATEGFVRREDLETLQRLVTEFQAELAKLGMRLDTLEGQVAFLQDHQFSTTTKLQGEAIFALTDEFNQPVSNNTVFQDRVRLTLNTSFTGEDRLVTRLAAGNADRLLYTARSRVPRGFVFTGEGQQTFNISNTGGNTVNLDLLGYYSNFGSSKVYLVATGGRHSDYAPTLNPYFDDNDGGNGALSIFATHNPIYRIGGGAGGAISLGMGSKMSILGPSTLTVGYLAGSGAFRANNPSEKAGLLDGDYAVLGQLNFNIGDRIGLGATYVHAYHSTGTPIFDEGNGNNNGSNFVVGSVLANNPGLIVGISTPIVTNSYGAEAAFRLTDNVSISGFATYTNAILIERGNADIWTYGAGLAFSDVGNEGNVLGLFAGVEPTLRGLSDSVRPARGFSRDTSYHVEGFFKYKIGDNISVTPGVIWITAPNQDNDNPDIVIGTLRTTFTF